MEMLYQKLTDLNKFINFAEPNWQRPLRTLELAVELSSSLVSRPQSGFQKVVESFAQTKKLLEENKQANITWAMYQQMRNSFPQMIKQHEERINYRETQYHIVSTLCEVAERVTKIDNKRSPELDQFKDFKKKYDDDPFFVFPHKYFTGYWDKASYQKFKSLDFKLLKKENTTDKPIPNITQENLNLRYTLHFQNAEQKIYKAKSSTDNIVFVIVSRDKKGEERQSQFVAEKFDYTVKPENYDQRFQDNYLLIRREYEDEQAKYQAIEGNAEKNWQPETIKTNHDKYFDGYIQTTNNMIELLKNLEVTRKIQLGYLEESVEDARLLHIFTDADYDYLDSHDDAFRKYNARKARKEDTVDDETGETHRSQYLNYIVSLRNQYYSLLETYKDFKEDKTMFYPKERWDKTTGAEKDKSFKYYLEDIQKQRKKIQAKVEARSPGWVIEQSRKALINAIKMIFKILFMVVVLVLTIFAGPAGIIAAGVMAVYTLGESCGWNFKKVTWDNVLMAVCENICALLTF